MAEKKQEILPPETQRATRLGSSLESSKAGSVKAANRGVTDIRLRERGTKKVHIFTGERKQIKKPKNAPAWMPAKIWKPFVKKVGPEKLDDL